MDTLILWLGRFGLVLTILPSLLLLVGLLPLATVKMLMVVGMVIWFVAAPLHVAIKRK